MSEPISLEILQEQNNTPLETLVIAASEHLVISEPEPEPEPITVVEPEPIVVAEPEPIVVAEPEPIVVSEPEPIIVAEPEPEPEPALQIEDKVPKIVFIVPYRDRLQQQQFFASHMSVILEDIPRHEYKIYYVHQNDTREFNRGAIKNIGFLAMKNKYPDDYKNITFVFNDVDTMPFSKNFLDFETTAKNVKHFYGYTFALGGIVSIKGGDFDTALGYPNFWAWGYEDNMLQKRVLKAGINIDRTQFYPIMDKNIFQMKDGITRVVNRGEFDRYVNDTQEGWHSIDALQYTIDETSGFIDVTAFETGSNEQKELTRIYDTREGPRPYKSLQVMPLLGSRGRARPTMQMRM